MKRVRIICLGTWIGLLGTFASSVHAVTLGISADGRYFTLDGVPTYLVGISYYGAQTITTPSYVTQDLDDMVARGFNWIRVWAAWNATASGSPNCSVLTPAGAVCEPYMSRLKTLITECNNRGMIVDVSMCRGAGGPTNLSEHLVYAQTLATQLASYSNIYFDIANECDIMDSRYVSPSEITQIVARCKQYKPGVLCTASQVPSSASDLYNKYIATGCDFIAPHLCRDQGCASQTYGTVTNFISWMSQYNRRMPVHLQEPFRRGYTSYNPVSSDFLADCSGGKNAQGAGWCLHNGSNAGNTRPYRCFDMKDAEGRLFAQLDSEEWLVVNQVYGYINGTAMTTAAPVIREVTPDPASTTAGAQYIRPMVLTQGYPWPNWSIVQAPTGAQINTYGQVTWMPGSGDIGQSRTFVVQATNANGSDTETWQVQVVGGPAATFEAEGANMGHLAGSAITGGWRITLANPNTFSTYGPYTTALIAGPLTARFWLRVDNNTFDNATICQLDVNDADGVMLAGPVPITRQQFTQANVYQAFDVNFTNPGNGHRLEFRTYYFNYAQLDEDKIEIYYSGGNYPPSVNAGSDQQIIWPNNANLNGTVSDDGLPNPPATVTVTWSKVSGPGTVTFGNNHALNTTASFSVSGSYTLRLAATDSVYTITDDIAISAYGPNDFIISAEEFIGSGTMGDTPNVSGLVRAQCDSSGNLHVAWFKNGALAYRKKTNGGSWGAEEMVPNSTGSRSEAPELAVASNGDVHVFWNPPGWNPLYYCVRTSGGWGARQTLVYNPDSSHASNPAPTMASDGRLHLVWLHFNPATGVSTWNHRIKTGGTWSSDTAINPVMFNVYFLTHDNTGKVYASGRDRSGSYNRAAYQVWNGSWGAPQEPANNINQWAGNAIMACGSGSAVTMSFTGYNYDVVNGQQVWYIEGVYGLTIGQSSVKLTQASRCVATTRCTGIQPAITYDSLGNQYFIWHDNDQLRYAIRKTDGTWYAKDVNFPVGGGKQYFPAAAAFGSTVHVIWEDNRGGMYHATIMPPAGPPAKATNPNPANGTTGVSQTAVLSWTAGSGATGHRVYFGMSNPPTFRGQQSGTTYDPGPMGRLTPHYWRIDEVNANGTTTGDLWTFTTTSAPGDFDSDGDVDLADFGYLQRCYSGSGIAPASGCEAVDIDGDNDVDQTDFSQFKNCLGGAERQPGC